MQGRLDERGCGKRVKMVVGEGEKQGESWGSEERFLLRGTRERALGVANTVGGVRDIGHRW